jgi:hypothetical protein
MKAAHHPLVSLQTMTIHKQKEVINNVEFTLFISDKKLEKRETKKTL